MKAEKLASLTAYANETKARLNNTSVPSKHAHRPDEYKAFLKRELTLTQSKIDAEKLTAPEGKAGK